RYATASRVASGPAPIRFAPASFLLARGHPAQERCLPDGAAVLRCHRRSGLARERLGEVRSVRDRAVRPPLLRGVRIGLRLQPRRLGPLVRAPALRESNEEVLLRLCVELATVLL